MSSIRLGKTLILALALGMGILGCAASPAAAQATFSLLTPSLTGMPGSTLTYSVRIENNSASTLYLNGMTGTTFNPFFTVDESSFFGYAPTSIAANSFFEGAFFDVDISPSAPMGEVTTGQVSVYGGETDAAFIILSQLTFDASVYVTPIPEPTTGLLALAGLGIGGALLTRRSRSTGAR